MKKARLGRGLDALLGETLGEDSRAAEQLRQLPIELIQRGRYQPRRQIPKERLEDLANSIRAQGVVQPIVVRATDAGGYELVAGERRWRAAQMAGLETVPAIVRDVPDEMAMALALIENIQREDLNAIDEAVGVKRLIDEFGLTHQEIADRIGRSRTAVTNLLRLLSLAPTVRTFVEEGQLDTGHARALLALPAADQLTAAQTVIERGLSVRDTEQLVRRMLQSPARAARRSAAATNRDIERLEQELSERLAAKVRIRDRGGKGRLTIEYHSLDELDGILERIR